MVAIGSPLGSMPPRPRDPKASAVVYQLMLGEIDRALHLALARPAR